MLMAAAGRDADILYGNRGLILSAGTTYNNNIDYVALSSTGNSSDFGDMTELKYGFGPCTNGTRITIGGGQNNVTQTNVIEYFTVSTLGNGTDFGDRTVGGGIANIGGTSNGTRGVMGGGGGYTNVIDYITLDTTGNATDFGDLTIARTRSKACSNGTRGCFGPGYYGEPWNGAGKNVIDYITIATTGNATDYGDCIVLSYNWASKSNGESDRGIFSGPYGAAGNNTIEYITISTTGNATNFGDSTISVNYRADMSNGTNYVMAGGQTGNVMDYVVFTTTGDASDFGDLVNTTNAPEGESGN